MDQIGHLSTLVEIERCSSRTYDKHCYVRATNLIGRLDSDTRLGKDEAVRPGQQDLIATVIIARRITKVLNVTTY
jgi:hypothetical protein